MRTLPVVFIAGPTASGKTDLALRLADQKAVSLINVDAAQVYRGMNIGTAKLDTDLLQRYPHALIDIRDPAQAYSAAEFRRDALSLIEPIQQRGRIPLLVGGTMLYFRALEFGLATMPSADPALRQRLAEESLRRAEKMEVLGSLAGGIAHDFNNVLMSIMGNAELLSLDADEHSREEIDGILAAGQRAKAEIVPGTDHMFLLANPMCKGMVIDFLTGWE